MGTDTQGAQGAGVSALQSARVHGALVLVLVLLAAFLFAATIKSLKEYGYVGTEAASYPTINVSGQGETFAVPDTASFTFSVVEEAETVTAVQEAAAKRANAAIEAVKGKGVNEGDIKTIAYELQPKYEWQPIVCVRYPCDQKQVQKGFTLTESVLVKVRDEEKAGDVLAAVTDTGVQQVSGLSFTIADEEAVRAIARKDAIEKAQAKARELAESLGVKLVRIVSFGEDTGGYPVPMYAARDAAMGGAEMAKTIPQLPAGENRIVSNVTVTYEIR